MSNITITSLLYLGFRLAPFILVSFFVLSSLINSDIKGLVFLAMLLCNTFITVLIGRVLPIPDKTDVPADLQCSALYIAGKNPISPNLPLNINVITFVFAYILHIIIITGRIVQNIPTLIVFPAFIAYQIYWSSKHHCSSMTNSLISMAIGGGLGYLFSMAIEYSKINELQYFTGVKNIDVCKKATKTKFKCGVTVPGTQ